jgi:MYXO-CTERM domain-containing protein
MGKAEALRQAQMEVREDYPNPYYWAGYVLSGEAGDEGQPAPGSQGGGSCLGVGMFGLLGLVAVVAARRRRSR